MNKPVFVEYVYIRDASALEMLTRRLRAAERVALDTEADSLHNYFQKVCLIQLSLRAEHYLVDPLCGLEMAGFVSVLAQKPLILHGGDYDLRMLRASLGFRPEREVFDTMIAAQLLGYQHIGLAALIERFFAVTIPKSGQKSDWSRRPLSDKQLSYAVNDTSFLERLADRMRGELAALERLEWHKESCQAMVEATGRDAPRDAENAWRLKGAGRLTRRQLAYRRELWLWRDELARSANLPAFRVLGNQELLELAHWGDSHPGAPLEQAPKLPRNITGARLATLTDAIARATAMGESEWPELRRYERELPRNDSIEEIDTLRAQCAQRAQELAIAPSTLAPKAALEAIARGRPRTLVETMACGGLLRWQAEIVQPMVEKCLLARRQ